VEIVGWDLLWCWLIGSEYREIGKSEARRLSSEPADDVVDVYFSGGGGEEVGREKRETRRRNYVLTSHKPRAQITDNSPFPHK
jgi:hypothetical protein